MDGNGNNIQWIGNYVGSPTWSQDGKSIAVGCDQGLCIIDYADINDTKNYLDPNSRVQKNASVFQIPDQCQSKIEYGKGQFYSGILSVSWSPDGNRIALVCGDQDERGSRSVCILSFDNTIDCWKDEVAKDIYRVAWSPVDENLLAISGKETKSKIYLTDPEGKNRVFVVDGWSPEWSPSGKKFAYIGYDSNGLKIRTINEDGTGYKLINFSNIIWDMPIWFEFSTPSISGSTRLSWSPNGRYIVFASSYFPGSYHYEFFRLDLQTGNVIRLLDNNLFSYPAEPDWSP